MYISDNYDNYFGDDNNSPVWYLSNLCLAVCIDGLFKCMSQILWTKYADPQFSIVFANSASNSKFKQNSA